MRAACGEVSQERPLVSAASVPSERLPRGVPLLPRTPLAVPQPGQAGWPHCLARLRLAMLSSPCSPVSAASVASVAARVVARVAVRVARVTRVVARVAARVAVRLAVREAVAKESEGGGGEAGGEHIGCGEERRGEGEEWAGPSSVA